MNEKDTSDSSVFLTPREVRELLASIEDARDRILLRLLYETGCTIKELVNIKCEDLLGTKVRIRSQESEGVRFPHISAKLSKDIRMFAEGNSISTETPIFKTRQGLRISEKRVRQLIELYCQKHFSKKISPHKFRYFHIVHAYNSGVLLENIARQLGITSYRAFQVIDELGITPHYDYNNFLARV